MGGLGSSGTLAARRTLLRAVVFPSWGVVLALAVPFAAGFELPERLGWVQYAPFAASLLFFGLPHGAVDHLVPGRLTGRGASAGSVAFVVLLYLALGGSYLALWAVAPVACFVLFILITWLHWGQGDLYSSRAFLGLDAPPTGLAILVRGALPMLVPLLTFPEAYLGVGESLVRLFGERAPAFSTTLYSPEARLAGAAALAGLSALYLWRLLVRGGPRRAVAAEAGEILLLALYFACVPPVLAVGVYFCLWHAPRHIARLALLDGVSASSLAAGSILPALARFVRDAAPLTLAALGLLAVLYLYLPSGGAGALLGGYLVLISVLTLPHVALVSWMDRRQRVWGA